MSRGELAEKHAMHVKESNNRIFELETAVADCEVKLQQAKVINGWATNDATSDITALRAQLNASQKHVQNRRKVVRLTKGRTSLFARS